MAETSDWKQKYRDSLLEMESEEKRWRQIEQALRRLVGRLCAAGMGVDRNLDRELATLAAANRRNANALELEQLAASLTHAVVAVDAKSPVPVTAVQRRAPAPAGDDTRLAAAIAVAATGPLAPTGAASTPTATSPAPVVERWNTTCTAVARLLQHLRSMGIQDIAALELITELPQVTTDTELAAILERTADLIQTHGEALAQERLQAASILGEVTKRLEEMAGYLTESNDETRIRFADSASVNDTVISHVRELTDEVNSATELSSLQTKMSACLATVTKQVMEFRSREENRLLEFSGRTERMRARIADLERETLDLHSKLDREKHRARLDTLTRLANRKSFDERIALAIERRAQTDVPVSMLLWDLDNFKFINDTYGHRAGDRVLQSVAGSFMSGLRAEDFVARIGGEEFVVLLSGLPFERALKIADELRRGVEALRFHFRGTPVRVTISCGLTELRAGDQVAIAFDRADAALYQAKHGGKNLCVAA